MCLLFRPLYNCPLPILPRYRLPTHQIIHCPRSSLFRLCWKQVCFSLLRSGADKNVLDRDGKTAQHLAHSKKRYKITAVLDGWKPMGLTATQTQKIIESRGEGPPRYSQNLVDVRKSFERPTTDNTFFGFETSATTRWF